ncbi:MAG: hypothetical protein Q9221_000693 [Calogaya cf. arnoldii]
MVTLIFIYLLLTSLPSAADQPASSTDDSVQLSPKLRLATEDDPRFSMRTVMSDTKLPPTAVLMNAVELTARYAGMDYSSRVPQRHGIVLPQFPQVEIAIIPVPPARTIEIRLVMYTIYGAILEMIYGGGFNESEIEVLWNGQVKAHVYFTPPMDDSSDARNKFKGITSRLPGNASIPQESTSNVTEPSANTVFEWTPVYEPQGKNIPPFEVFLLALGAIKVVATESATAKVGEPLHIGSDLVNANIQVWPDVRARPTPPFLRYGHVLEAVRRIPAWQLARHRFAEFFCGIEANRRPLGVVLVQKGQLDPNLGGRGGNVSTS